MVDENLKEWRGLPVQNYQGEGEPNYGGTIYRISFSWDNEEAGDASSLLKKFLSSPDVVNAPALIIGNCADDGCYELPAVTAELLAAADKLPNLRALFLGEVGQDECEISWIEQSEMSPILKAFPGLEELRIRGGTALSWQKVQHMNLKKLVIETGGLPSGVLRGVHESTLPELEHLELWTGSEDYGWDGGVRDVRPFLHENRFPKLRYLGLRNSDIADEVAIAAADAPILSQLEVLDLSLGTLRDKGAKALLESEAIKGLKKLDLHRHFMSAEMYRNFLERGHSVNVNEREEPDSWDGEDHYYVSVSE